MVGNWQERKKRRVSGRVRGKRVGEARKDKNRNKIKREYRRNKEMERKTWKQGERGILNHEKEFLP